MNWQKTILVFGFSFCSFVLITSCDPCRDTACNNGTVEERDDECICECDEGYEGETCDKKMNQKYEGDYKAKDTCSGGNIEYGVGIRTSGTQEILIDTFGNTVPRITVKGKVTGTHINIPEQTHEGYKVKGDGKYRSNDEVAVNYVLTGNGLNDTCQATYIPR